MPAIERQLQRAGLLPVHVQACRWRMNPDAPGGYVLTFTVGLPVEVAP